MDRIVERLIAIVIISLVVICPYYKKLNAKERKNFLKKHVFAAVVSFIVWILLLYCMADTLNLLSLCTETLILSVATVLVLVGIDRR